MATLSKKSPIVEICSQVMYKPNEVKNEDYQEAQEILKELATKRDPMSLFELGQLVGFLVDDKLAINLNQFVDEIADVKRVSLGDKAEFKKQRGNITALWQAKGSTALRTMVGTKYVTIETDEISVAPAVDLEQLQNGQIDFTSVVNDAVTAMEVTFVQKIETVLYAYWSALSSPWYASGNGITPGIDTLITAIRRLGTPLIFADIAAAQKFVPLTGFNNIVPESIAVNFNETGVLGNYRGARIVQLNNPLANDTDMTTTVLDKGYVYIVPSSLDRSKRSLKVVFEGEVQTYPDTHTQSRIYEVPMYKKVGIGLVSNRFPLAVYEDSTL